MYRFRKLSSHCENNTNGSCLEMVEVLSPLSVSTVVGIGTEGKTKSSAASYYVQPLLEIDHPPAWVSQLKKNWKKSVEGNIRKLGENLVCSTPAPRWADARTQRMLDMS